ncbi:hypothetical protein BC828DRAFT_391037 [Blastocladiella britannica]|nr:hypothetical protein BC828DRAFT_391037 [Blastocladiella britannica]
MKFGKQIQGQALSEWHAHYMNYKALKKIINSLDDPCKGQHALTIAAALPDNAANPLNLLDPAASADLASAAAAALSSTGVDPLQSLKANFFYKLERELDRVNSFYLTKEQDTKVRLRTLLEKRRRPTADAVTLRAIMEALWQVQQDLTKLQHYVELNAVGFRKILKKWDKRSKSSTKELYLARQVDIQPCFNRDTLAELTDVVAAQLAELSSMPLSSPGNALAPTAASALVGSTTLVPVDPTFSSSSASSSPWAAPPAPPTGASSSDAAAMVPDPLAELELSLASAVKLAGTAAASSAPASAASLGFSVDEATSRIAQLAAALPATPAGAAVAARVAYRACKASWASALGAEHASVALALLEPLVAACGAGATADDINERTLVHGATLGRSPAMVAAVLKLGVPVDRVDVYGRTGLHYAALAITGGAEADAGIMARAAGGGQQLQSSTAFVSDGVQSREAIAVAISTMLVAAGADPSTPDHDGATPLVYSVVSGCADLVRLLMDAATSTPVVGDDDDHMIVTDSDTTIPQLSAGSAHHLVSLAAEYGHLTITQMLIGRGAPLEPDEGGLHPLHIAAKQGHLELTRLLASHVASVDISDKYYNWSPLFYAAADGHFDCAQALLTHGARASLVDETGWTPLAHALYRGHVRVATLLSEWMEREAAEAASKAATLASAVVVAATGTGLLPSALMNAVTSVAVTAATKAGPIQPIAPSRLLVAPTPPTRADGDPNAMDAGGLDMDAIPSLALPPPILPFRIYGHMYLESKFQVQLHFPASPVELYAQNLASLRLVVSAKPEPPGSIPHTVVVAGGDGSTDSDNGDGAVAFQTPSIHETTLHIDVYPVYGTRAIARGVVLPREMVRALALGIEQGTWTVPLFDGMALVGELSVSYALVAPFAHPRLSVGGAVATYWKTTQVVPGSLTHGGAAAARAAAHASAASAAAPSAPGSVSSLMASPVLPSMLGPSPSTSGVFGGTSNAGTGAAAGAAASSGGLASLITASSLANKYVHIPVQVTRDGVPVVFPSWSVSLPLVDPAMHMTVPVAQLNLAQFVGIGRAGGHAWNPAAIGLHPSASQLAKALRSSFLTLRQVLAAVPRDVALLIELKFQQQTSAPAVAGPIGINGFVNSVLADVYDAAGGARPVVFCSFNRNVCNAVNWKQPNYPVFFNTYAGYPPSADDDTGDADGIASSGVAGERAGDVATARPSAKSASMVDASSSSSSTSTATTAAHASSGKAKGARSTSPPPPSSATTTAATVDRRGGASSMSLKDSIRFAKANNMLGLVCFTRPMLKVPALVQAVKESGLLVATFGDANNVPANIVQQERAGVDGVFADGVLRFTSNAAAGM